MYYVVVIFLCCCNSCCLLLYIIKSMFIIVYMYVLCVCMYVLYCTIHFAPVGKNGISRLLESKL